MAVEWGLFLKKSSDKGLVRSMKLELLLKEVLFVDLHCLFAFSEDWWSRYLRFTSPCTYIIRTTCY